MRRYDVTIAGGGIAGLATAEIFARSGWSTLLIEKNQRLCTETSGSHHEWFHLGSLYSIFPNRQFLRTLAGGVEDLFEYYRDFDGMNLRVDGEGGLVKVDHPHAWFRPDNLEYIIATTSDPDFDFSRVDGLRELGGALYNRLLWNTAIRLFICRHNRFHKHDWRRGGASSYISRAGVFDYSRRQLTSFDPVEVGIELDPRTHLRMPSYDGPMHALHIVTDLTRSLLAHGGEIRTSAALEGYRRGAGGIEVSFGGETVHTRKLILATGAALGDHAAGRLRVQSVRSPLLIAYPAVCERNVVRLTPFIDETVNHLLHSVDGHDYSLIGGGHFAEMDDAEGAARVENRLIEKARDVFPRLRHSRLQKVYFGTKSEVVGRSGNRNYLYRIDQLEPDVTAIVPGKFSLAFSLAMTTFRRVAGAAPVTHTSYDSALEVDKYVDLTIHRRIVRDFVAEQSITDSRPAIPLHVGRQDSLSSNPAAIHTRPPGPSRRTA